MYILYKKFNKHPVPHDTFMEELAKSLIDSSLQSRTVVVSRQLSPKPPHHTNRLHERHFPAPIGKTMTKSGSKKCAVCNFGKKQIVSEGYTGVKLPLANSHPTCVTLAIYLCVFIHVLNFTIQKKIIKT